MTARIQIALLSANLRSVVAVIDGSSRVVLDLQQPGGSPTAVNVSPTGILAVELPMPTTAVVGQVLPVDMLPEPLRSLHAPSPMATAEFHGSPSTGSSALLNDIDSIFKFANGDQVRIGQSAQRGTVEGRGDYKSGERRYFVRFNDRHGMPAEDWFMEDSLEHTGDGESPASPTAS